MITAKVGTETVEILDVFPGSGRKVALVKYPTERNEWTHGGWAPTRTGTVDINLLRDIQVESDDPELDGFYPRVPEHATRDFYEHY
jgi:hypothetical protein